MEQIRNHRYFGHNRTLQYLIYWKGYPDSNDTWELAADTHAPDLVKSYHKGTPLESIKTGRLSLQNPISLHPGYRPRTIRLGRKFLDTPSRSTLSNLPSFPASSFPIYHPQVSHLPSWTTHPSYSHPCSRTSILLPRTPLYLSLITANTTPSSTSGTTPLLPCPTTPSMHQLNPQGAVPIHPHPATPLVEWKTYSPPTSISTLPLSERSQLVWSRPSRTGRKSIALLCLPLKARSKGLSQLLRDTPKLTNGLPTGTSATLCTPTSRSHWAKERTLKPTGSPRPMTGMSKHMGKNKGHWTPPTPFLSTPRPSTHPNPSTPFPPGFTNSWLVPPPFTLTSPKQPTDLMTGASLRILRATANWTTTCPVSTRSSNGSKLKLGQLGLRRPSVKVDWSWLVPPSSWCTWSVWRRHSFGRGMNNSLLGGDGRSLHAVMLARVGGDETGLR